MVVIFRRFFEIEGRIADLLKKCLFANFFTSHEGGGYDIDEGKWSFGRIAGLLVSFGHLYRLGQGRLGDGSLSARIGRNQGVKGNVISPRTTPYKRADSSPL
jgi:hypothetical protein